MRIAAPADLPRREAEGRRTGEISVALRAAPLEIRGERGTIRRRRCRFRVRIMLAFAALVGWLATSHAAVARRVTMIVTGRLPAQSIRDSVVREHGKLRACYEEGLRRNASLDGVVTTRFVIGRDGAVSYAADGGSDIGDPTTVACVVGVFRAMRFAAPPDAGVFVSYPVHFTRYGGGLRRDDVRLAIAGRLDRVRLCSEAARTTNPGLTGTFSFELDVDRDGVARARDAGSDVADRVAVACVVRGLDRIALPAPWAPASVVVRMALAEE